MNEKLLFCFLSVFVVLSLSLTACSKVTNIQSSPDSLSSGITPPSSSFPVDIIGRVTIAQTVIAENQEKLPQSGNEFWIVQISIRNKTYQTSVTSDSHTMWKIGVESSPEKIWGTSIGDAYPLSSAPITIQPGQSGEIVKWFSVVSGISPTDYQIWLAGYSPRDGVTIPNSWGNLVNSDTMATVYNWDQQKIILATKAPSISKTTKTSPLANVATLQEMYQNLFTGLLAVVLKPNNSTKANTTYKVDLLEKGTVRATKTVTWNQPELNVLKEKNVEFPMSSEERDAYPNVRVVGNTWWKSIFDVRVYQ